ncbi:MAG: hypothetical protein HKN74_00420 [Acidimicrobiia bacterium]|nr:hypothetical protein [Acidimicrobiia bacterium]MBT8215717.1 hypothetical protein [Acidimicrobiia bacterium]NNF08734.1 hypothetical protein [Acidimicrobiia bacterium]NNL70222.1 hypothetical protein [Acidimicrobiia bacterium]
MGRGGGEAAAKRARERSRLAKRAAKEAKRAERAEDDSALSAGTEAELMAEFAELSAGYEAKRVSHDVFVSEKLRIFEELGIEAG